MKPISFVSADQDLSQYPFKPWAVESDMYSKVFNAFIF